MIGLDFLTKEEHEKERLQICKSCEKHKLGFCMACGCSVKLKVKLKSASCPLEKWKAISDDQ